MPRVVDPAQRRAEIADAVNRIALDRGLRGVSFREVAAEAGVSVSLVQHYFGSKDELLIRTLEIQSTRFAGLISGRLAELGEDTPEARLRAIASAFIPTDEESHRAMHLYLSFAGAALSDAGLRGADAFRGADTLVDSLAVEVAAIRPDLDARTEASAILALVLGLSLGVLLEQASPAAAVGILDGHLARLSRRVVRDS